ncbi:MAG: GspMb/PilO family protein [Pseudomonadota bacterium]
MIERLSAYFEKSLNQRTVYGLIALLGVLGVALVMRLDDTSKAAEAKRLQFSERLARRGGDVDEDLWRTRADIAKASLSAWRETRWTGSTAGIVAADMQTRLNRVAANAGVNVATIDVDPRPIDLPAGKALRFRIIGDFPNGDKAAQAIAELSAHEPMFVINEMTLNISARNGRSENVNRSGRLSALGFAPIVLPESDAAESG